MMRTLLFCSLLVSALFLGLQQAVAADLEKWTGGHTRIAWVQDHGDGSDSLAKRRKLMLYGFDSRDGRGERPLIPHMANIFKPMITPDGRGVVISDRHDRQMFLVDWKTGKMTRLGSGVAVALWEDPEPKGLLLRRKTLWVYCFFGKQKENKYGTAQPLYRFPIDQPEKRELVWNKTNMAWSNVQLSRDGSVIGGLFPWPHGGVLRGMPRRLEVLGRGCWTSLSPDNSKLFWIFDGLHRNVQIHDIEGKKSWKVNINHAPGIGGYEVYHPRWSNHPRYFTITGPYEKGEGGNRIGGGGEKVEIYLGRFDRQAKEVEDWYQVTRNKRADFYPDVWIEGGEKARLGDDSKLAMEGITVSPGWPLFAESAIFVWENMAATNQLSESGPLGFQQTTISLKGQALFGRGYELLPAGGFAHSPQGAKLIDKGLALSGEATVELVVTPAAIQDAPFLLFEGKKGHGLFLQQQQKDLLLGYEGGQQQAVQARWQEVLVMEKRRHLSLVLDGKTAELFVDGKSLGQKKLPLDLRTLKLENLLLGNRQGRWQGKLSHLGIYNRPMDKKEIGRSAAAARAKEKEQEIETLHLRARLVERSEIPAPKDLGTYRRALVVNVYEADTALGKNEQKDRFLVAEWAVLDGQIVKSYGELPEAEELFLQPFDANPQLEGERLMMDVFEPDLTMYYRLLPGAKG